MLWVALLPQPLMDAYLITRVKPVIAVYVKTVAPPPGSLGCISLPLRSATYAILHMDTRQSTLPISQAITLMTTILW